ncbi:MAG TPA: CPBP family intramembrane glutamic endopeptidase [Gemmatimonadaceae bacterium]|nr:CPBP family intramembrane glutamic endopeptidase [Gemmatimonadaceae bacterium]
MDATARRDSFRSGLATAGRIVLFLLVMLVASTVLTAVQMLAERALGGRELGEAAELWGQLGGVVVATWVMLRVVERSPWATVGLGRGHARPPLLAEGFALGAAAIALPTLLLVLVGWLRFAAAPDGSWWQAAAAASWLLVPAALLEEVLMRGYLFHAIWRRWGPWAALVLTSVVFGALHLGNPGATALSITLVTLAGFFLGGVVLATGSVWAAWTAHLAWNWTMAVLLHTAVSGIPLAAPDYQLRDAGPDWATGGPWGPEGGVGAAAGMLGGIGYLIMRRRRRQETVET